MGVEMRFIRVCAIGLIGCVTLVQQAMATGAEPTAQCRFEQECFEAEACTVADFALDIEGHATEGVTATTDFGPLEGSIITRDGTARHLVLEGPGAIYFLSIGESGARLSVHMEGPVMVSYLGTCEGGI